MDSGEFELPIFVELPISLQSPPDDDWASWLAVYVQDPTRADVGERLDRLAGELRERGELESVVEILLGRVEVELEAARRAQLLAQVALLFEHELDDSARALTALIACWREAPEQAEWHELSRLADAAAAWDQLEEELGETLPSLPASVRVPLWRKLSKWASLADALDEHALEVDISASRPLRAEAAALLAERLGEPEQAIARFEELLAEGPDDLDLSRTLAALYRRQALSTGLDRWWESLLTVEPGAEDALRVLARSYRSERRWGELAEILRRLTARAPADAQAELFVEIGQIFERELADRPRAVEAWRQAEAALPSCAAALEALTSAAEESGDHAEALALYDRRALLVEGEAAELPLRMGAASLCLERLDDLPGAEARLIRALELAPQHVPALSRLATLLDRRGERELALERHLQVMALAPDDPGSTGRAAELLWRAGRHAELVPILKRLTATDARGSLQVERLVRLGHAAAGAGLEEDSAVAFARAAEIDPLDVDALRGHAAHVLAAGAWSAARPLIERILSQRAVELDDRERLDLLEDLARCELELGSPRRARTLVGEALALDPGRRSSLLLRIEIDADQPEALIESKRALAAVAENEDEKLRLLSEIGELAAQLGQLGPALRSFGDALELQPNNQRLLHRCLELRVQAGDWDQALEVLEQLAEVEKSAPVRAKYQLTAALICRDQLARLQAAALHLRAALEEDPDNERAREALERLYATVEDWRELARFYRTRLKQLGADGNIAERLRLWSALADLCATRLGEPESAVAAQEAALALDPGDLSREKRLADLYVQAGPSWFGRSIDAHQQILRREKGCIHSYRALKHLYIQTLERDKSLACSAALMVLKQAEPDDAAKLAEAKRARLATARRPLGDDGWSRVMSPDEDRLLDRLFALIGPTLAASHAVTHKQLGLTRTDAIPESDPHSYNKVLTYLTSLFEVPRPEVYARPDQLEPVLFHNCVDGRRLQPVLLLGRALVGAGRNEAEQVFELGRKLALLTRERILRLALPDAEKIATVIEVALTLGGAEARDAEVAQIAARLAKALPPPALELVVVTARQLLADGIEVDASARRWLSATDLTSLRAGWLLVGDLELCGRLLAAEGVVPGALPATQRLLELIWSSTTEELLGARRLLGFTIK